MAMRGRIFDDCSGALVFAAALLASPGAFAQGPAFYQGKTVQIVVGFGPGGGYDVYARLLARFYGKYLPGNPNVVVQNTPGGGGLVLANRLYNTADKEGATLAVIQPGTPQVAIQGDQNAKFDPLKFTWIGACMKNGYSLPSNSIEAARVEKSSC